MFFLDRVLNTGTDAEFLSIKHLLCEKLKNAAQQEHDLKPEADDQISCNANIDAVTDAIKSYGQLSIVGEEFLKCSILGDVSTAVKGQMSQLTLVIRYWDSIIFFMNE